MGGQGVCFRKDHIHQMRCPNLLAENRQAPFGADRRPDTAILTRQSSCADTGKGWASKEKAFGQASVTRMGLSSSQHLPFQCVLSHSFISQDVHTQVLSWLGQLMAPSVYRSFDGLGYRQFHS